MNITDEQTMNLSKRVLAVAPSLTLAITAKAKELKSQGIDVISLGGGEPDFDTPEHIKAACVEALARGATKYTPVAGILEFRQAISDKIKRDQGLQIPVDQIVVGVGAKHAIFNTLFALINEGDEVVIPAPYWLSYPEMVQLFGGKSVFIATDESTSFKVTAEMLRANLSLRSKILFLNSPSNPTGSVYDRKELQAIAKVLDEFPNVIVISDEIYEKLVFGDARHFSIASISPEIAKRTVIINGHSKAYSMTGWRLGYAVLPTKALAEAVSSIQSHSTSNPTSFAQYGGIEALNAGEEDAKKMCAIFEKRKNFFFDKINSIPKLKPFMPQGAFYLFVNIAELGMDSITFAERLLDEAHVAVVPGKPFGSDQHVRMSFSSSEEHLAKAAERIAEWVQKNA